MQEVLTRPRWRSADDQGLAVPSQPGFLLLLLSPIASPLLPFAALVSRKVGLRLLFLPPWAPLCSRIAESPCRSNDPMQRRLLASGRTGAALCRTGRAFAETNANMIETERQARPGSARTGLRPRWRWSPARPSGPRTRTNRLPRPHRSE